MATTFKQQITEANFRSSIDGAFLPWSISLRSHLISEYPLPDGVSPIPEDVQLPPQVILERDSVIRDMVDRFTEARATGVDRNGLDCKAARFSHVDAIDPELQENDLRDKRQQYGQPLYSRLCERSAAEIKDYRGINYLDRHNVLKDHLEKYQLEDSPGLSDVPPEDLLPIPNAWAAMIEENQRLTPEDHWQDVRKLSMVVHPRFSVKEYTGNTDNLEPKHGALLRDQVDSDGQNNPGIEEFREAQIKDQRKPSDVLNPKANTKGQVSKQYELHDLFTSAGDTVMLYPKNFPEDVQALIDIMGWHDVADEPFKHYKERDDGIAIEHAPANCYPMTNSTLRQLLTNNYDITAIPKRSFFDEVRFHATDPMEKERLTEFSEARFIDEFYDYTSRPRRSILEILQDFSSIRIPYQYMPMIFPLIRGREYSMASAGPLMEPIDETEDTQDTRVELLVAMVKYKTVLRKTRRGLCSRYIEALRPGTKVNITIGEGGAPFANSESMRSPLLAIATGTGLAPIRAAFWERELEAVHGRNVLFFGARNEKADFFFKDEWPSLGVEVYTAFSRDQKEKIYVQDVIRREHKAVCELIQEGATIMVCGSSGKMPVAVRETLQEVIIKGGIVKTADAAKTYLLDNNHYWEEVW